MARLTISSLLLHFLLFLLLLLTCVGFTDQTEQSESEASLHRSKRATDPCSAKPCQNGRKCKVVNDSYECDCNSKINATSTEDVTKTITTGWTGKNCETDINECKAKACFHQDNPNVCQNRQGTFKCFCDGTKYVGTYCEKKIYHCLTPHPDYQYMEKDQLAGKPLCANNGNCSEIDDKEPYFKCSCAPGYEGVRCRNDIDECEPKPCKNNANCTDMINAYKCTCVPGFEGKQCETNIDECKLHTPCKYNASCIDKINDYECNCTDTGYEGRNCSTEIDECKPKPCKNGANCTDGFKKFTCACHPGYEGADCSTDIDECSPNPCMFNSTCLQKSDRTLYGKKTMPPFNGAFSFDKAEGYVCECVKGTKGVNCSTNIDECKPKPCKNGANCTDKLGDYKCDCKPGYTGRNCEKDIDECELHKPCKNNANCTDKVNDYECVCAPMDKDGIVYGGRNCSKELRACRNHSCQNGATCKPHLEPVDGRNYTCNCKPGWTKWDCTENTVLSFNGAATLTISGQKNVKSVEVSLLLGADTTGQTLSVATFNGAVAVGVRDKRLVLNGEASAGPVGDVNKWMQLKVGDGKVQLGDATGSVAKWLAAGAAITEVKISQSVEFGMVPYKGCLRDLLLGKTAFVANAEQLKQGAIRGCTVPPNPCKTTSCAGAPNVCLKDWKDVRCLCELGRTGSACETETLMLTFGQTVTSYAVYTTPAKLKQMLQVEGKVEFATQLMTRSSKKANTQQLLAYIGLSKAAKGSKAQQYVMLTINDKGQLQVFIASLAQALLFTPSLGDGYKHNVILTISKTATELKINGTTYSPQPGLTVPDLRALLGTADLLCIGGYKGLAKGTFGDGAGLVRKRRATTADQQVPPAGIPTVVGLNAALGDTRVAGQKLALSTDDKTKGAVTSETVAGVQKGVKTTDFCSAKPSPCKNDGQCENVVFNTFNCTCKAGFREQDCSFTDFCATGTDLCPTGFNCKNVYRQKFYECAGSLTFPDTSEPISFTAGAATPAHMQTLAVALRTRLAKAAKLLEGKDAGGAVKVTLEMTATGTVKATSPDGTAESTFKVNTGEPVRVVVKFEGSKAPVLMEAVKEADFTEINDGNKAGVAGIKKVVLLPEKAFQGCISSVRVNGYPCRLHNSPAKPNESGVLKWRPEGTITLSTPAGKCKSDAVCSPNPCKNGRACKDEWNKYTCDCGTEYTGTNCENPVCKSTGGNVKHSACANGGSCVTGATVFTCNCADGWLGARCAIKDKCKAKPCLNSGTCKMDLTKAEFECTCTENWKGKTCDESKVKTGSVNYALIFGLIGALLLILVILLIFLIVRHVRASRATSGNYNPHTREVNGSNVYMSNVIKPPPGERLI